MVLIVLSQRKRLLLRRRSSKFLHVDCKYGFLENIDLKTFSLRHPLSHVQTLYPFLFTKTGIFRLGSLRNTLMCICKLSVRLKTDVHLKETLYDEWDSNSCLDLDKILVYQNERKFIDRHPEVWYRILCKLKLRNFHSWTWYSAQVRDRDGLR